MTLKLTVEIAVPGTEAVCWSTGQGSTSISDLVRRVRGELRSDKVVDEESRLIVAVYDGVLKALQEMNARLGNVKFEGALIVQGAQVKWWVVREGN